MNRFLSKDLLSGLMFIAFGMAALYFGQKLALGTPVRMGPGYVPHMLSFILLSLGSIIVLATLFRTADRAEKERYWIPVARPDGRRLRLLDDPLGRQLHRRQYPGTGQPGHLQDHDGPVHGLGTPGDRRHHPHDPGLVLRPARRGGRRSGRGAEMEADHHGDDRHRLLRAAVRARGTAAGAGRAGPDRLAGRRGVQAHRGHRQHRRAVGPVHLGLQGRARA